MSVEDNSAGAHPPTGGSRSLKRKACAACRYQRNRCGEDCQLAPHFPAECHDQFTNAHNLYGVGNMRSLLRRLEPIFHSDAMKTVKYESDARARDRAGGCYRIILQLDAQYQSLMNELDVVKQHLAFYRSHANSCNNDDGNVNGNGNDNVAISSDYQQQLQDQDQPDFSSFCSDVDVSTDDAVNNFLDAANNFLNEDDANILGDDVTAYYNGNEAALFGHQQFTNITDPSVCLLPGDNYWL